MGCTGFARESLMLCKETEKWKHHADYTQKCRAAGEEEIERQREMRMNGARRLELVVKAEVTTMVVLLWCLLAGLLGAVHNTSLLVFANTLLEEVGLATKRDVLHEVKGVGGLVHLLVAEGEEETIGDKLNVLLHESRVHAKQSTRKSLGQELLLDSDSICDDLLDESLAGAVPEVGEEQAGEVGVETLVTRDEFIGKCQTGHETTLLHPEDGSKSTTEEDTFDSSKCDQTLTECRLGVIDPS